MTLTNNLSAANRWRIQFTSGATSDRTINGSTANTFFDFGGNIPYIQNDSSATHTINFRVINGNSTNSGYMDINANSGTLVFGGGVSASGGTRTIAQNGAGNVTYSSVITNESGATLNFDKNGSGAAVFTASNSYGGTTTVNAGALTISHASALGATNSGTTVASGASLRLSNGITVTGEALTISGTGLDNNGALVSVSGNNAYTGLITLGAGTTSIGATNSASLTVSNIAGGGNELWVVGAGTTTIAGGATNSGSGTALVKTNTGTLILAASNAWSGDEFIREGTVVVSNNNALGTGGSTTIGPPSGSANATLTLGSGITNSNAVTFQSGGSGTLTLGYGGTSGTGTQLGNITQNNNATFDVASGGTFRIAGTIANAGTITNQITGGGTLIFSAASTGGSLNQLKVGNGTVVLGVNNAGTTNTSTATRGIDLGLLVSGVTTSNAALYASNGVTVSNSIYVAANSSGATRTIGASDTGATVTYNNQVFMDGTARLEAGSGSTVTFSGNFTNGSGTNAIEKIGSGLVILSASNNHAGTNVVTAGTLRLANNRAAGNATNVISVASGATLELSNAISVTNPITLNGSGVGGAGALRSVNGLNVTRGTITLASDSRIEVDSAAGLILSNSSGNNTIAGTGRALTIGGSGNVTITNGGTTNVLMMGAGGSLTKEGAGTLSIGGNGDYTGGTTLNAGTLRISSASSLGTGTVTLNSGTFASANTGGRTLTNNLVIGGDVTLIETTGGTGNLTHNTGTVNLSGATRTLTVNPGEVSLNGVVSNGGITKAGAGTLTITDTNNSYAGGTTLNAGTLRIGGTGAVLGSGALTLNGGTLASSGSGSRTFANNIVIGGDVTLIETSGGTGNLIANGTVDLGGATRTLTVNTSAGEVSLTGLVSNGGLAQNGPGTLHLSNNANSFTGALLVNNGTVAVTGLANSNSASAAGAGTVIGLGAGANSGTLRITNVSGTQTTDRQVRIGDNTAGTAGGGSIISAGNNPVVFNNTTFNEAQASATAERTLTIGGPTNSGVNEISGLIQDNNTAGGGTVRLTKSGGGTWTLTGTANTFSGRVMVDNGTLIARTIANSNTASSLGQGTEIQLGNSSSGILLITNSGAAQGTDRTIIIGPTNSAASTAGGTIRNDNTDAAHTVTFSNATFNTAVSATATRNITLRGINAGLNEITGVIQDNTGAGGAVSLTKADSTGVWYLSGTASTFSGLVNVGGGSLLARTIANSNTASSLGQGAQVQLSGGTLIFTNSGTALGTDRQVVIGLTTSNSSTTGGTIQNANADAAHTVTFSNAAFNAPIAGVTAGRTLTLRGANTGLNTISGVIADNDTGAGGTVGITKQDSGTWYLSGTNNSFSGRVQVSAGDLLAATIANAGINSSLGNGADEIQLSGGTLVFTNSPGAMGTDRKVFIGNATVGSTAGATIANANTNPSATVTFSNAVFNTPIAGVTAGRTLTLRGANTGTNTISGVIADNNTGGGGTVSLTKQDGGTWILSGDNTYTGRTLISGGTLQIGAGGTTGSLSASSAITNNSLLVFNRSDTITQGTDFGNINGSGGLTMNGTGTLELNTGANNYSGQVTINAGTVSITQGAGLSGNTNVGVTFGGNGTLQFRSGGTGQFFASRAITITNGVTGAIETLANATVDTAIGGAGSLAKAGAATLTLTGGGTYTGGTFLNAGALRLNHVNAAGTGSIIQSNGTSTLQINAGGTITNAMSVFNVAFLNNGNTLSGTITNNNATYDVAAGTTNTISGFMTGSGGLTKTGEGVLSVTGTTNDYAGATTISNGTLRVGTLANAGAVSSIGTNAAVNFSGTNAATTVLDYTGGNVATDRALTFNGTAASNEGGTLRVSNTSTTVTLTGSAGGTGRMVVAGGTVVLSNTATSNNFAPAEIRVDSGATLALGADNQIGNSTGLILNGGTFRVGDSTTGFAETLGTLTLSASSTIDLGAATTVRNISFADSSAITWTGTLTITNWQGIALTTGDAGRLLFGTGGLTSTQLSQVYWAGPDVTGPGGVLLGPGGELVPIPEPRVYAAALALLAAVGWRERRRVAGLFRRR